MYCSFVCNQKRLQLIHSKVSVKSNGAQINIHEILTFVSKVTSNWIEILTDLIAMLEKIRLDGDVLLNLWPIFQIKLENFEIGLSRNRINLICVLLMHETLTSPQAKWSFGSLQRTYINWNQHCHLWYRY